MPKPPVPERTVDGSKLHNLGQRKLSKGRFIIHQDLGGGGKDLYFEWVWGDFPVANKVQES